MTEQILYNNNEAITENTKQLIRQKKIELIYIFHLS